MTFTELHISGDLSQALAVKDGQTLLFDREGVREAPPRSASWFFANALDIERVPSAEAGALDEADIAERLKKTVVQFQTLHRLLVGMDGRLSHELSRSAIREANRMLRSESVSAAVARRILRVPRGHDWRPRQAARFAREMKAGRAADVYELVSSGILEGLEAHVWKRSGADGLRLALDFGLIADGARAIAERDEEIITRATHGAARVALPVASVVKRYCIDQIRTVEPSVRRVARGLWRDLSPEATPSLEELLNDPIPAVDSRAPDQASYPGWLDDHALHRRFYVTGLGPFLKRFNLTARDAEWMTLLGPEFVIGKTSWGAAPGDWRQPASKLQFNRALRGEALPLSRAGLVIASVAAAAIDMGAPLETVFEDLGVRPACFRIPTLTEDLVYAVSQNEPGFDHRLSVRSGRPRDLLLDMIRGYTVTLDTARAVREMLFKHDDSAAVGEVVGSALRDTRGASPHEDAHSYRTLRWSQGS